MSETHTARPADADTTIHLDYLEAPAARRARLSTGALLTVLGVGFLILGVQARGDARAMLDRLAASCRGDAACRAMVARNAQRLKQPGAVKIIAYDSKTSHALGSASGRARIAWTTTEQSDRRHVQCVLVHRGGNPVTGTTVTLERISGPIGNESSC